MGCPSYPNHPTLGAHGTAPPRWAVWGTPRKALMRFDFGLPHTVHTSNTRRYQAIARRSVGYYPTLPTRQTGYRLTGATPRHPA
jgi:hypothetical protein